MSGKRIYIASKVGPMEEEVKRLKNTLESRDYNILYDWTENPVSKPFQDHPEQSARAAHDMAQAVMNCDILIVLFAEGGIGFHIETGGALVSSIILSMITGQSKKEIYVVGNGNDRSVFYFHDSVKRLDTVEELLEELCPPC